MTTLHHKLKSGRVLLLDEPLTAEELAEFQTDEGNATLEILADIIAKIATSELTPDDPRYAEMLKAHQIEELPAK